MYSNCKFVDLEFWFVSSTTTKYTYRNVYCAMCNGELMNDLVFWDVDLQCTLLNDTLVSSNMSLSTIYRYYNQYHSET